VAHVRTGRVVSTWAADFRLRRLACGAASCVISPPPLEPTAAECHCLDALDAATRARIAQALAVLRDAASLPRERTPAEIEGERAAEAGWPCVL